MECAISAQLVSLCPFLSLYGTLSLSLDLIPFLPQGGRSGRRVWNEWDASSSMRDEIHEKHLQREREREGEIKREVAHTVVCEVFRPRGWRDERERIRGKSLSMVISYMECVVFNGNSHFEIVCVLPIGMWNMQGGRSAVCDHSLSLSMPLVDPSLFMAMIWWYPYGVSQIGSPLPTKRLSIQKSRHAIEVDDIWSCLQMNRRWIRPSLNISRITPEVQVVLPDVVESGIRLVRTWYSFGSSQSVNDIASLQLS